MTFTCSPPKTNIKNIKTELFLMATYYSSRMANTNYYGSRRGGSANNRWAPNHNATRHTSEINLGPLSQSVIMIMLVVVLGVLFLFQSTSVTSYDHRINDVNSELADLEAERDALAVENAKINAAAARENDNQVAATMVDASSSAYVSE